MKKALIILLIMTVICSIALSACTKQDNSSGSTTTTKSTTKSGATSTGTTQGQPVFEPLGKYDPPITLRIARSHSPNTKYLEGESLDNNAWIRAYRDVLGIEVIHEWVTPGAEYYTKLATSIASRDIPDFFVANRDLFVMCVENDLIQEIGTAYENYRSPLLERHWAGYTTNFKTATVNGKLMAWPEATEDPTSSSNMAMYRHDWLVELGMDIPKTQAEMIQLMLAITKNDPDGNDQDDTFGFGLSKGLWGGGYSLEAFFNAYHAFPNIWIEKNGKLEFGSVQPEMKLALADLAMLFSEGVIDPEFGVKDGAKLNEDVASDRIGLYYGRWHAVSPGYGNFQNNPKSDWRFIDPVSVDENITVHAVGTVPNSFFCINKNYPNPEVLIKLNNLTMEYYFSDDLSQEMYRTYGVDDVNDITPQSYMIVAPWPYINTRWINLPQVYRGEKDPSELVGEALGIYQNWNRYLKQFNEGKYSEITYVDWIHYRVFSDQEWVSNAVRMRMLENCDIYENKYTSFNTPGMTDYMSTLQTMLDDTIIKIITGQERLEYFDKFVADWYALGGNTITNEVNEWYKDQ